MQGTALGLLPAVPREAERCVEGVAAETGLEQSQLASNPRSAWEPPHKGCHLSAVNAGSRQVDKWLCASANNADAANPGPLQLTMALEGYSAK